MIQSFDLIFVFLIRYQRVSPDCLPLTNGTTNKPYLKPSPSRATNDDTVISGRGFNGGSCTTTITNSSLDGVPKGFRFRSTQQQDPSLSRRGGDVLLQWGQRKRSRASRAEIRSTTITADDSSSSSGQGKIQSSRVLRRSVNPSMPPPPPPPPVFSGRSSNPRNGFVVGKESFFSSRFSLKSSLLPLNLLFLIYYLFTLNVRIEFDLSFYRICYF